jgi:hypothetical protein
MVMSTIFSNSDAWQSGQSSPTVGWRVRVKKIERKKERKKEKVKLSP